MTGAVLSKEEQNIWRGILALSAIPRLIFGGFVLSYLWAWFVSPIGVPEIGIVQAIGLHVLVTFVTRPRYRKFELIDLKQRTVIAFFYPVIILTFGWILHLFV